MLVFTGMELRHLRYFVAVADTLSFTKGAEKLRLAQPSLTRQIKDLEERIGVRLFDRTKRRVSLTEEGKFFLAGAKRVLAHSAEIVQAVQRFSRQEGLRLNIGYAANLFYSILPPSLAAFQCSLPTVSINLFDMTCGDQFRALENGKIDIGFVGFQETIAEPGLEFRSIASYKTVAALAKNDPLTRKATIKLKDLEPMFFISLSEASYPGYRDWLIAACRQAGVTPKILHEANTERTLIQAVESGLGVGLLPDQIKKLSGENVLFCPISPVVASQSSVAWKKENASPALKAYLKTIADFVASER
jgi:DNA-binding transcriptional LysR family regulator